MKYLNQYRIRWWVSAFFQIALFAAAYLPAVTIVAIDKNVISVDSVSRSALWYLANAGFPGIYTVILTLFALLSLPCILLGFKKQLKPAPLLFAAITDIVYLIINVFWAVFIFLLAKNGDFATTTSLTVWFWVFSTVNLAQTVHLFILFFGIKKSLTI